MSTPPHPACATAADNPNFPIESSKVPKETALDLNPTGPLGECAHHIRASWTSPVSTDLCWQAWTPVTAWLVMGFCPDPRLCDTHQASTHAGQHPSAPAPPTVPLQPCKPARGRTACHPGLPLSPGPLGEGLPGLVSSPLLAPSPPYTHKQKQGSPRGPGGFRFPPGPTSPALISAFLPR